MTVFAAKMGEKGIIKEICHLPTRLARRGLQVSTLKFLGTLVVLRKIDLILNSNKSDKT